MKRVILIMAAVPCLLGIAAPVAAAERPIPPACNVITNLPFDVIGHLLEVSPSTAQLLIEKLTSTCGG